jgi:hypothetical protein
MRRTFFLYCGCQPLKLMGLFGFKKSQPFSESVVYYCLQLPNTYFLRFYSDGTVMYMGMQGDQTASMHSLIQYLVKEHTYYGSKGQFLADDNKINYELTDRRDGEVVFCEAALKPNGELHVYDHYVSSGKRRELVYKPVDEKARLDWNNPARKKDIAAKAAFFDPRESTTRQLEKLLGRENLTAFDSEFLEDVDSALPGLINDLLQMASKELPGFFLQPGTEDRMQYIEKQTLLYDLNVALEAKGSTKRFFYYWDNSDFSQDHGYFYAEKETGIRIIQLLKNPPYFPFSGRNYDRNRIIDITLKDPITHEEVKYFKQLIMDF